MPEQQSISINHTWVAAGCVEMTNLSYFQCQLACRFDGRHVVKVIVVFTFIQGLDE